MKRNTGLGLNISLRIAVCLCFLGAGCLSSDITEQVFGPGANSAPAAFGDFNSDELTDLFVVDGRTVQVLFGAMEGEPLFAPKNVSCTLPCPLTSVVPGDFNGDAFLDVVVTTKCDDLEQVFVLWGNLTSLQCTNTSVFLMKGQPLALDYNYDFITDLFGEDELGARAFWIFRSNGSFVKEPVKTSCGGDTANAPLRHPHSNAYLDLDDDHNADLFITSGRDQENQLFEVWTRAIDETEFRCKKIMRPPRVPTSKLGQSVFLDVEQGGRLNHVVPLFTGRESKLFVAVSAKGNLSDGSWHDLALNLTDPKGVTWQWAWDKDPPLTALTIRSGDFNMDGYPDLLAPLRSPSGALQTVLLANAPCSACRNLSRQFQVSWNAFYPQGNDSVAGAFFDIFQDGVMDVILVYKRGDKFSMGAIKNNLDYDANFIKVMVVSGLSNEGVPFVVTPLGKHKRTFGSNVGGPRVWYRTLDQAGRLREGVSIQLAQTAHFALGLPYTTFALGRTPNFVDGLAVSYGGRMREWPQIIPNSQMVVIPNPVDSPQRWKAQLFVTPSKVILLSAAALIVVCVVISLVIAFLHWKERHSDRLERLQGDDRFYFDVK